MAKNMTPEELNAHLSEAISDLQNMLGFYGESDQPELRSKAMKLGYWIKTYVKLIRREANFTPESLPAYKPRQIVNVDFGFRVGAELGGLHYAVVLDVNNSIRSPVLAVVPLGSLKASTKPSPYKVLLEKGVYELMGEKAAALVLQAEQLVKIATPFETKAEDGLMFQARAMMASRAIKQARDAIEEIKHMKLGTIANISQVTTISKLRVVQPVSTADIFNNLRVTEEDMKNIRMAMIGHIIIRKNIDY